MKNFKSFINVLMSNFLILIIGIIQSFILPELLGPSEYGKWSTYLLYIGYAGLFSFGFCDGIYLKYGGKKYDELDYRKISSYYFSHQLFLGLCLLLWIFSVELFFDNKLFLILVGLTCFLSCNRDFYWAINASTARLNIYAKIQPVEKITIIIGVLFSLLFDKHSAMFIIWFAVFGWFITMILNILCCHDIVFTKPNKLFTPIVEYKNLILSGLCLTITSIGISLLTGVGKFIISSNMGNEQFGYYSFIFSVSALFTQVFSAISLVFFPLLKQETNENSEKIIKLMKSIFNIGLIILLPFYFPLRYILLILFPQYKNALDLLIVLIPLVILQGKIDTIFNTIYKIMGKEKRMLHNIILSLIMCGIINFLGFLIKPSIITIGCTTFISIVIWHVITIIDLNRTTNYKMNFDLLELSIVIIFIILNLLIGFNLISLIITILMTLFYIIIKWKDIKSIINFILINFIKKRKEGKV